jgi:putative transposase
MPRTKRVAPGGTVFHALNRGVGRMKIFSTDRDYFAFEETVEETLRLYPMRILAYCLMPNHWHFVLWPEKDGDLSAFLQRLANTHTQRWQRAKNKVGYGHLYQGRFKSFPVETDDHFYTVVRYVERNALHANLVEAAESWRWGSLWRRVQQVRTPLLTAWPLPEPRNWVKLVNEPQTEAEVTALRRSIQRGSPFGGDAWVQCTAKSLGLESTVRPRGRPKTNPDH